ncbi:hypothetical protein CRUP_002703, partial [Coryphaenoides rupestris]
YEEKAKKHLDHHGQCTTLASASASSTTITTGGGAEETERPLGPGRQQGQKCGRKLMLLNPFRVEEALLFKRLLENNILAAVALQNPIQLTDGLLGGSEYTQALCNMEQGSPELDGRVVLSDPRLMANGFQVTLTPVEDLREILASVLRRNAATVQDSRPLKGEAVRLARQLPSNLTRQEVEDGLSRMTEQLGEDSRTCIHGRPFLQQLSVVPGSEQEARSLLVPMEQL